MPKATASRTTASSKKSTTTKRKTTKKKTSSAPSSEQIQERAYYIWLDSGCPSNSDFDNWITAEKELSCN